jgi:hypothetical protein
VRNDGWLEIGIRDFFISLLKVDEVHMSVMETCGALSMGDFFVEGIEKSRQRTQLSNID